MPLGNIFTLNIACLARVSLCGCRRWREGKGWAGNVGSREGKGEERGSRGKERGDGVNDGGGKGVPGKQKRKTFFILLLLVFIFHASRGQRSHFSRVVVVGG